ncbi:hypothetical protein [uncultured Bacteroides sp.]|jgi:hypothetical protein|uniref:hypothetical protein n=1 Tax=uncultured Bacteroides sp. TaxID=162156 RepID=UPI0023CC990A|nr:hypothetical protein [uncultured Bacteroides sp.]MDE6173698.1 hypothetical protein [Bacteroides sp.]
MTQIIELNGTEKRLYQLVAPLVMNPKVLKQNNNYPFRTSENFKWFVAVEGKKVVGFLPLEHKKSEAIINNYYVKDNNTEVLKALLEKVIDSMEKDKLLTSVTLIEHQDLFLESGFSVEKLWRRYVKMIKEK